MQQSRFFLAFLFASVISVGQSDPARLRLGPIRDLQKRGSIEVLIELPKSVAAEAKDFQLIEDVKPTVYGATAKPLRNSGWKVTFVLALDTSRSLKQQNLEQVKAASIDFVTRSKDPIALITFADEAVRSAPFGTPPRDIAAQISGLGLTGQHTRLYDALNKSLDLLEARQGPERQRIIVISDGSEESLEQPDYIDRVLLRAEKKRIAIDTIWIKRPAPGARNTLVRMSERTDGFHGDAMQAAEIQQALEQVLDRVARSVVVSFDRKLGDSGEATSHVGINVNRLGVASASIAYQIPKSSGRTWAELFQDILAFLGNVQTLLGLLGGAAAAHGIYAVTYVVVEKRHPGLIPRPWFFPKAPEPEPVLPEMPLLPPDDKKSSMIQPTKRSQRITRVEGTPAAVSTGSLILQAVKGPLTGQRIPIERRPFRIGADADNDLSIASDGYMSGHHAIINGSEGGWILVDQGSTNGTFIDGQRLTRGPGEVLRTGQSIQIGGSEFLVIVEGYVPLARAAGSSDPPPR